MNKIYSKVWSKALRQMVVASELAKSNSGGTSKVEVGSPGVGRKLLMVSMIGGMMLAALPALGQEATVVSGDNNNGSPGNTASVSPDGCGGGFVDRGNPGNVPLNPGAVTCGTAIGHSAYANNNGSVALGAWASAAGDWGAVAVGASSYAGYSAIAMGAFASAGGTSAISFGRQSSANGAGAIALGNVSYAESAAAVAIGNSAYAASAYSIAIGGTFGTYYNEAVQTRAQGLGAIAIGNNGTRGAQAGGANAIAIGGESTAAGVNSIAVGKKASAAALGSTNIAIGNDTVATGINAGLGDALAIGAGAKAIGQDSTAIGGQTTASATNTLAIGNNGTTASKAGATAFGAGAQATGTESLATGNNANASATNSMAIGSGAKATNANSVALGVNSATAAAHAGTFVIAGSTTTAAGTTPIGVVSVGTGVAGGERQIQNVGAGVISATSTDAVNGSQLHATNTVINNMATGGGIKYFHANSALPDSVATGTNSVAVGPNASSLGESGVAVGRGVVSGALGQNVAIGSGSTANSTSNASPQGAVAVGQDQHATGDGAVAIGSRNTSTGDGSVALGRANDATGAGSLALGDSTNSTGSRSIALGTTSSATFDSTVAIGNGATANTGLGAIAVGRLAASSAANAIAMGNSATATVAGAVAIGKDTNVSGTDSVALGTSAISSGRSSAAIGRGAKAYSTESLALGLNATAGTSGGATIRNYAIGTGSLATGGDAIALGDYSQATAAFTSALGEAAKATAASSTALGVNSQAAGTGSLAAGSGASAAASGGVALGSGSISTNARDVALGSSSVTAAAVGTADTTINGVNYGFAGTAPLSVVSVGSVGSERQITNVAAGRVSGTSTDAVNGSQLFATNAAVGTLGDRVTVNEGDIVGLDSRISTNEGDITTLQGDVAGNTTDIAALQDDALLWDPAANGGAGAYSANHGGTGPNKITNVADGTLAAGSTDAVNGSQLYATNQSIVDLGDVVDANKTHYYSVNDSGAPGGNFDNDGALGVGSIAAGIDAGTDAAAINSIAIGSGAFSAGSNAMAVGVGAKADFVNDVAFGTNAHATGTSSGLSPATAFGYGAIASSTADTAFGTLAHASGGQSLALGYGATSSGVSSAAFGTQASATAKNSVALGGFTYADGDFSTAVGGATASAEKSIAIGDDASATAAALHGIAIGDNAIVSTARSVALGDASTTATAVGTASGTVGDKTYTYAGTAPVGTVSVGKAGDERTVTNVAAGRVGAASTDAINGSQLFATNQKVGENTTDIGDLGDRVTVNEGDITTLQGDVATNTTDITALQDDALLWDPAANGGAGAYSANHGGTGPNKITNVADGTADNDAVNRSQLDAVSDVANAGWNVTTAATGTGEANGTSVANVAPGETMTISAGNNLVAEQTGTAVALGVNPVLTGLTSIALTSGPSISSTGIAMGDTKITGLAAGTAATDAVNKSQLDADKTHYYSVNSTATGAGSNYNNDGATGWAATAIGSSASAPGEQSVSIGSGSLSGGQDGIAVGTRAFAGGIGSIAIGSVSVATSDYSVAIGRDARVLAGTNGVALGYRSRTAATVATTNMVVNGTTYNVAGSAPAGTVSIGGNPLQGAANRTLTNVSAGRVSGTSTDAVNGSQLFATNTAVGTLGDRVTVNEGDISTLDDRVTVNEGDITTLQGDVVANTTDITALQDDALLWDPVAGAYSANHGGTGPNKITNVADGTLAAGSTDAVNGSQLYTTNQNVATNTTNIATNTTDIGDLQTTVAKPISFSGNDDTAGPVTAKLGDTVAITGTASTAGTYSGGNVKTVTDATTGALSIQMADAPKFGTVTINDGGKITGLTAGTAGTDAVNKSQLDAVSDVANTGWDITTAATGTGVANGTSVANVGPGDTATITAGNNMIATQTGTTVALGVNPVLTGLTSIALTSGPSISSTGIAMGGTKITGLAAGTDPTDAVNKSQLDDLSDNAVQYDDATKGSVTLGGVASVDGGVTGGTVISNVHQGDLSATSTDAVNGSQLYATNQNVATNATNIGDLQDTVAKPITFSGNDNTSGPVTAKLGETVAITGAASTAGTYSGGNVKTMTDAATGALGIQIADAPKFGAVTINDGNSGKITGVTAGTAGTDAVNKSQLDAVSDTANTGWDITTAATGTGVANGTSVANVGPGDTATITAGNNMIATQTGTTVALGVNPVMTGLTSIALTSGPSISSTGIAMGGTKITGLAAGTDPTDAVNKSQLDDLSDNAVQYDDATKGSVTLAGTTSTDGGLTNGTVIGNVAQGDVSNGSTEAVNGTQLWETNQDVAQNATDITNLDGRVTVNEGNIATLGDTLTEVAGDTSAIYVTNNGRGVKYVRTNDTGLVEDDAHAQALGSTAVGYNAIAAAENAVAIGRNTVANGANSTALGQGAVTNGDFGTAIGGGDATDPAKVNSAGRFGSAVGFGSQANGVGDTAMGTYANTGAANVDPNDDSSQSYRTAVGYAASATGDASAALGAFNDASGDRSVALGYNATSSHADSVALGANSATTVGAQAAYTGYAVGASSSTGEVNVGGRKLTGLAAGEIDSDGVNVSQLKAVDSKLDDLSDNAVLYDDATKGSVTLGGTTSTDGGLTNGTVIGNVAQGDVSNGSTEAVNGTQLWETNQDVAQNATDITNLDGRVTVNEGAITQIGDTITELAGDTSTTYTDANGVGIRYARTNEAGLAAIDSYAQGQGSTALGYNAVASAGNAVAIGRDAVAGHADSVALGANSVTMVGAQVAYTGYAVGASSSTGEVNVGGRKLTGLAAGEVDSDGVNVSQLKAVDSKLDDLADNAVQYDDSTKGTVTLGGASSTDGGLTNGTKITNVAQGDVSDGSTDAVNGTQLNETNENVAQNATNIANNTTAITALDGRVTTIEGDITNIGNGSVGMFQVSQDHNTPPPAPTGADSAAGGANAVASGDGSLAVGNSSTASGDNGTALGNAAVASGAGSTAVGQGAEATADGSVALGNGASDGGRGAESYTGKYSGAQNDTTGTVSVGNAATGESRTISNVADAKEATDAVNLRQLDGAVQAANDYTDTQISKVSGDLTDIAGTVNNIQKGADGMFQVSQDANAAKPEATGTNAVAGGNNAVASGNNGTAVGNDTVASGEGSTALGNGAQATAANSVAIGAGSTADRANSVSVGSAGAERQITNVAAGTAKTDAANVGQLEAIQAASVQYDRNPDGSIDYTSITVNQGGAATTIHNVNAGTAATDAVNVGQLDGAINKAIDWSTSYTDQRFDTLNKNVNAIGNRANGGIASAMAMASLPQAYAPNQSAAAVALGNFHGETGIAVGVSTITESGRYVFKLNATSNTRGDTGVGVGAAVVW